MLEIFVKGGPVMWPLLLCSIIALAVIIERAWFLHRARMNIAEFMERINAALASNQLAEATRICEEYRGPLSSIFLAALKKHRRSREEIEKAIESSAGVEVAKMERNLVILATMGKMAPLLGFYGTVTGMIGAFESIAKAGMGDPGVVAGGIAEALITTAAGLTIAIPTVTVAVLLRAPHQPLRARHGGELDQVPRRARRTRGAGRAARHAARHDRRGLS